MTPAMTRLKAEAAAQRHERLVDAAKNAPHGRKLDHLRLVRKACHERMKMELEAGA